MLTNPHQIFCERIVAGLKRPDAYLAAFPKAGRNSAWTLGGRLLAKKEIRAEIRRLRTIAEKTPNPVALSLAEKRSFLARIVRAKVGVLPEDSDLLERVRKGGRAVLKLLPDKLEAIELDNKLAGQEQKAKNRREKARAEAAGGKDGPVLDAYEELPDFIKGSLDPVLRERCRAAAKAEHEAELAWLAAEDGVQTSVIISHGPGASDVSTSIQCPEVTSQHASSSSTGSRAAVMRTSTSKSQTLAAEHLKFCEGIALGLNGADAYAGAYPKASRRTACSGASRLLARDEVQTGIARLRAQAAEIAGRAALTLEEKRSFLARVVRARPALLPEDSDLWQGMKSSEAGAEMWLPAKLDAIAMDNELAGEKTGTAEVLIDEAIDEMLERIRSGPSDWSEPVGNEGRDQHGAPESTGSSAIVQADPPLLSIGESPGFSGTAFVPHSHH